MVKLLVWLHKESQLQWQEGKLLSQVQQGLKLLKIITILRIRIIIQTILILQVRVLEEDIICKQLHP